MAGETPLTVIGNLTADPEIRFIPSGSAVANFTIASTPRTYNRDSGQWEDGEALFMRCSIWNQPAENVAESLYKGMRVIASGRLKQRSFETREGDKRTVIELEVDEIGPSVKFGTATFHRAERGGGGGQQRTGGGQRQGQGGGQRRQGGGGGGWGGSQSNEGNQPGHGWGRTGGGQQRGGGGGSWGGGGGGQDPWASAPATGGQGGYDDEPPF